MRSNTPCPTCGLPAKELDESHVPRLLRIQLPQAMRSDTLTDRRADDSASDNGAADEASRDWLAATCYAFVGDDPDRARLLADTILSSEWAEQYAARPLDDAQ